MIRCSIWTGCLIIWVTSGIAAGDPPEGYRLGNVIFTGSATGGFSISRYDNWQSGGSDTLAINAKIDMKAEYRREKSVWLNTLLVEYGTTKLKGKDRRKSADILSLESKYNFSFSPRWSVYGRFSAVTTMSESFVYKDDSITAIFDDGRLPEHTDRIETADAFEPLNLDEGAGIEVCLLDPKREKGHVSLRTGLGARQFIASAYYIENDDDETEEVEFQRVEEYADVGWEAGVDVAFGIVDGAALTSRLNAFYGFADSFWKVTWDTELNLGLGKYAGVSLGCAMVYDEQVFDDPQWKTTTLLTVSYRLF